MLIPMHLLKYNTSANASSIFKKKKKTKTHHRSWRLLLKSSNGTLHTALNAALHCSHSGHGRQTDSQRRHI